MTAKTGWIDRRSLLAGASATIAAPAVVRAQAKSLKIALMLPRSGFFAQAGQSCHRGALASGKVLADLGYKVELVHIDTETNADVARAQAEKAINDGCGAIVGAFESGQTLAIAQVCEQRKVPLICNVASAPQLTSQGYQFLVRNFMTGPGLVTNGLKLITEVSKAANMEFKTAVFMHSNDTFGTAQGQAMEKIFPTLNMPFKIVESIAYDPKAQDLSVEVTKVRGINPDLLLIVTRAGDAIKLTRDMVRQKFQPKAIMSPGSPGLYDQEFFDAVGVYADGFIYNLPWFNVKSQMTQALEASFKATNPKNRFDLDGFNAGFTFEALLIAADAFKRAGSGDGETLMKAIKATNIKDHVMIGGPIVFNEKGDNPNIGSASIQNIGQKPTVVFPADVAVAKPILPFPAWQGRK